MLEAGEVKKDLENLILTEESENPDTKGPLDQPTSKTCADDRSSTWCSYRSHGFPERERSWVLHLVSTPCSQHQEKVGYVPLSCPKKWLNSNL